MTEPLNQALKFKFEVRRMSDGSRFRPTPDPTVDVALYPNDAVITPTPTLTWDAVNLQYTYTLPLGNVTLEGWYYISILITDNNASSLADAVELEVRAVPTGLSAAQVWAYSTRTLTAFGFGAEVTLTSPINQAGDIEAIYQGSDYYTAEGNALVWTLINSPSLVGATAVFNVAGQTFAATINTSTNTITVELPRAKTALMTLGRDKYALIITFVSTHRTVKVIGYATVYLEPS